MSAFATALAALHADPNMADAAFYRRPPWPWAPTRIVRTVPTNLVGSLGGPGARAGSLSVDVLTAALAITPHRGDEVKLGTIVYTVEDAERDTLGLSWRLTGKSVVFLDSITDLTRQAMAWAKTRPEAFSEKTGKPDIRGAYGLMAREVIGLLKHLQHAPGKTTIMVGILEKVTDEFGRVTWQPQMEGGKAGRELPGIVDQVISMGLFSRDGEGWRHDPDKGTERRLVCRSGNSFSLPAKDRSGRLDETEPPDIAALLRKINSTPSPRI